MNTMTRRRTRLRSSQSTIDRWKPSPALAVLAVGLILGLALGMRGRMLDPSATLQEHYLLLVSDLYAQGYPLASVRDRLIHQGYTNPSVAVVGVADQLASSTDKVNQQEADQLHQFAAALVAGTDRDIAPAALVSAGATAMPTALATPVPSATVTAIATYSIAEVAPVAPTAALVVTDPVAATPAPASTTTPPPEATVRPAPPGAPATAPAPSPVVASTSTKSATVKPNERVPVFLRKDPNSKSAVVASVPYGSSIDVKGIVSGEAVQPGDTHWYKVNYLGKLGYIYAKYVQLGG